MSKRIVTLHDSQTQISSGNTIIVDDVDTLVISISGTSTSFLVDFLSTLDGINYFPISGNNLGDISIFATSTSVTGQAWQFDVTGLSYFRANLTTISNGNVTVLAKAWR